MTSTEDRLAQALRARTDLITPERLAPAEPPVATPVRLAWRRPALFLLAAAACATAVTLPFVLAGGPDREPGPVETPPTTMAPAPTPAPTRTPVTSPTVSAPVDDGFAVGASPFRDRDVDAIDIGQHFSTDLDGGGEDTISLDTPGDAARLTVRYDDGTVAEADLQPPAGAGGAVPTLHTTLLSANDPMLVVRWGGPAGVSQVYDASDHQLRLIAFTSYFGNNQAGEGGGKVWSVLSANGSFYALRQTSAAEIDVFTWQVAYDKGRAAYLVLGNEGRPLGSWCSETPDVLTTYRPC